MYVRQVPTHRYRLDVINFFAVHGMPATLERFFPGATGSAKETKRKSVHLWSKRRDKLERLCAVCITGNLRRARDAGAATTLPRDTELELLKWINGCRAEGAPVSALMLQCKALQLSSEISIDAAVFSASWMWRQGFLRRHKLVFHSKTRQGQISPADATARAAAFSSELQQRMAELGVDNVCNADQTPVFFEHIPTKTLADRGTQTVWIRSASKAKECVTCMLLGDSCGNKFESFLILKTSTSIKKETAAANTTRRHDFGTRLWTKIDQLQCKFGVQIFVNATAWWNSDLSIHFLEYHFSDRRGRPVPPLLLLWDDFSAHWLGRVVTCAQELRAELMRVPAGYTSVCQPADVSWNPPLKQRLRVCWAAMLHSQLDSHNTDHGVFKLSPPSRNDVVERLSSAWSELSSSTIGTGFSPILAAQKLSRSDQDALDALAIRLQQTHLLDQNVGIVSADSDVVDGILEITV